MDIAQRVDPDHDRRDRHSLACVRCREIEEDLRHARSGEAQRRGRLADDFAARVAKRQPEHVVDGVHARLTRIGVRTDAVPDQDHHEGGQQKSDGAHDYL